MYWSRFMFALLSSFRLGLCLRSVGEDHRCRRHRNGRLAPTSFYKRAQLPFLVHRARLAHHELRRNARVTKPDQRFFVTCFGGLTLSAW